MFIYKLKPQKSKGKGNDFSTGNQKMGQKITGNGEIKPTEMYETGGILCPHAALSSVYTQTTTFSPLPSFEDQKCLYSPCPFRAPVVERVN